MTTDNRTNEQIVAEALREGVHVAGGGRSHLAAADVTYALGKAGRLVDGQLSNPGQFTEAQVKLAYLAHLKAPRTRGMDVYGPMRAALVAAHGAAPQADEEHFHIWSELPCKPGQCRMDHAPVLPSSGVDEDACWHEANCRCVRERLVDETALAEVIRRADAEWQVREARLETASKLTHAQYVARAVAEWLKGGAR